MELTDLHKCIPGVKVIFMERTSAYIRNLGSGVIVSISEDHVVTVAELRPADTSEPMNWKRPSYSIYYTKLEIATIESYSIWN